MKRTTYVSLLFAFFSLSVAAQSNKTIKVEGIARISEVPEEIIVSVDLTIKDSLYQDCFNKSMASLNALKKVFKNNGIDPKLIKSKAIAVNENYEWQQNKRHKTGYISHISIEVKGAFTQKFSESLLKSLDQKNLNINYQIAFGFSEEQKTKLRKKVIELAVADATEKAETIAQAAKLKLIGISTINYGSSPFYGPMDIVSEGVFDAPPIKGVDKHFAGVDLNPKEQQIQKSISIEWAFE
ncbi:SIMPL domain-containing protein [Carboxylicivirga sp. A043]|uniref:SIMPL domain-containing protein n=1 Tax=Carboxylicivirga litoralis TaxID=2816963 RepID=UPI0021CB11FC|nr:SIMPL domain-containing protein [Carboxylicivirga sp. A043]MCU4155106.1 SIMPL domain-containing protein [Carboxylicivirga sp. A043]